MFSCERSHFWNLRGDTGSRASTVYASEIRDNLKEYFYDERAVDFLWQMHGRMMIIIQPSPVKYQLKTTEITSKLKKENCENVTYLTNLMQEIKT